MALIHALLHHAQPELGLIVGTLGILIAVVAHRRAARAVAECTALINGSVVVRYDALSEMSGQLSFSVALLNALGDGVVLSSINGRSETRTYAKVIRSGGGTQPLSPEEEHAVRAARLGQGLPAAERTADPGVTVRTRSSAPMI